jgi:hypothetical protein
MSEAFAGRLRDEVDLDTLTAKLLGVVHATMHWSGQPTALVGAFVGVSL